MTTMTRSKATASRPTPTSSVRSFFDGEDMDSLADQLEHLHELLASLNEEVAAAKEAGFSEARIREIIRDEMRNNEDC